MAMSAEKAGFRHEALVYRSGEDFLAGALPFLREGFEAGQPALVAVSRTNTALLQAELGADAGEVRFAEMGELGRNPARIIPFWRDFVDEHGGRPVRGIGEPVWPGRKPAEIEECQRHESLLNLAFSPPPAWSLLCPYDGTALDDEVLDRVACSHRVVVGGGGSEQSTEYAGGTDCFAGDLPPRPAGAAVDSFGFGAGQLAAVRRRVEAAAKRAGLPAQSTADLVIATSELAANSAAHGGGAGTLRTWRESDCLVVEVEDRGRIDEALVGRLRPSPTQKRGRGLWLANQLCDLVQIRSGASGTTIRLHAPLT